MTDVPVLGSTGVIQFYVDGGVYGAPVSVSAGAASLAITGLSVGAHTITATYSGDTTYGGSTSSDAIACVATGGRQSRRNNLAIGRT
jgi:hypothetical protein